MKSEHFARKKNVHMIKEPDDSSLQESIDGLRLNLKKIAGFQDLMVKDLAGRFSRIDKILENMKTQLIDDTRQSVLETFIPVDTLTECLMNLILKSIESQSLKTKLLKALSEKLNLFPYPKELTDAVVYNAKENIVLWLPEKTDLSYLQKMKAFCLIDGSPPDLLTKYHLISKGWAERIAKHRTRVIRRALLARIQDE
jgi:hypothetical protein